MANVSRGTVYRYFGDRTFPELDRSKFTRPPEGQLDLFK